MDLSDKKLMMRRVAMKHTPRHKYPVEKRIEVVTKCLALGNMRLVAELTGVSYGLIRNWKAEPWWDQLVREIKAAKRAEVDTKLSKIVDKSLATVEDRLDNGEWAYDKKTGEAFRKPVSLLTANKVANDLLQRQKDLSGMNVEESAQDKVQSVQDQIALLAQEFAKFNTKRTIDVVAKELPNAIHEEREEGLQAGKSSVQFTPGAGGQSSGEEPSSCGSDEKGFGEEGGWEGCGSPDPAEQGWDEFEEQFEGDESEGQPLFQPSF